MAAAKHILYDNWLYYNLETKEIQTMLQSQEKIIEYIDFLDLTTEEQDYIFYKQNCLLFELHRRSFRNCMIQMFSVCKVKCWLPHVTIDRRCKCCNLEYYEFSSDLIKIEQGELKCSGIIKHLLVTKAFDGGRALGGTRNDLVPAMSSTSSSSTTNVTTAANLPARRFLYDENHTKPIPAPRASKLVSFISSSSSESSDDEDQPLVEYPKGLIVPTSILKNTRPDLIPFTNTLDFKSNDRFPKTWKSKFLLSLPFSNPKKRNVSFKTQENRSYSYQKLEEDKPSTSTADIAARESTSAEKKPRPAWSFASKLFK